MMPDPSEWTRLTIIRCLDTGDPDSARAYLRSKRLSEEDRARVLRHLRAAVEMAREVLP